MKRRVNRSAARATSAAAVLALVLAGCSSGGDGGDSPAPVPVDTAGVGTDTGGTTPVGGGQLAGSANPAEDDATGVAADNPFQTGAGARPTEDPPDTTGGPGLAGPGASNPFAGGDPEDDPVTPAGGAVLDRLQNTLVGEELMDAWFCAAPQLAASDIAGVAYVFLQGQGALVVFPEQGEAGFLEFTSVENSAGTVSNTYAELEAVESMTNFSFAGSDAFTATSDLTGQIECQRFLLDDESGGTEGPDDPGQSVEPLLQNGVDEGGLLDGWACQGPQASAEVVVYAFVGGQGLFGAFNEGQDPVVLPFDYVETSPGTLELTYEDGFEEIMDDFAFASEAAFSATSSSDGPLSCELVSFVD